MSKASARTKRKGPVSVESIVTYFETLPDPRHERNRRHLLVDMITIAVCGVIVGCDGPTSMAQWAKAKQEWLETFLELPHGIPSRDCIRRVLTALKPLAFQQCFEAWMAHLIHEDAEGKPIIAIDGKTLRRSHDRRNGLGPLHLVSAWASQQGLSLGQVATEEKSNEITAIPELLDQIDVKGAVVTIDAMGCQKEIARQIVDGQGDYVLAVKENQPKLYEEIRDFFSDERLDERMNTPHREHCTSEQSHGRQEERYYVLATLPRDFPLQSRWPGLKAIGMALRVATRGDGTTSCEERYFISSRYLSGKRFAEAVRGHWGIENSLHWVLDVSFDEDQSRTRQRHMASNLAWLRRFAISLLKRHPAKDSIVGRSRMAGWNNDFLLEVLVKTGT